MTAEEKGPRDVTFEHHQAVVTMWEIKNQKLRADLSLSIEALQSIINVKCNGGMDTNGNHYESTDGDLVYLHKRIAQETLDKIREAK